MKLLNSIQDEAGFSGTFSQRSGRYTNDRLKEAESLLFTESTIIQPIKERLAALVQRAGAEGAALFISTDRDIILTRVGKIGDCTLSELDELMLFSAQPIKRSEQYLRPIKSNGFVVGYILIRISADKCSDLALEVLETYADLVCHELDLAKKKTSLENFSEQLEAKKEELRKAHLYSKNLLSITSHDLSSPLSAVSGYLDLMNDCLKDGTKFEQLEGYHQRIQSGVQDVMDMLKQLSDINRIERGAVSLDMVRINASWLVREVCELIESKAAEKNIRFSIDIVEGSAYVEADIVKLKRVVYNLVTNAIKYIGDGGTVKVRVRTTGEEVLIDVMDDGAGIPPSDHSKVFSPFVKLNKNRDDDYTSSGLGLYIASYFTELMDGTISLESKEGMGSSFTVSFPRVKSQLFGLSQTG